MGLLIGRAGRLTAENGGFRPGQTIFASGVFWMIGLCQNDFGQFIKFVLYVNRPGPPGRWSALRPCRSKSSRDGAFVRARRTLSGPFSAGFSARAVVALLANGFGYMVAAVAYAPEQVDGLRGPYATIVIKIRSV
jgi:hypothetical protein